MHVRKMDSSDRRIDEPVPSGTSRQSIIDHARQMFKYSDSIEYHDRDSLLLKIDACKENLPVLYFSRSMEEANQCYTNAGTIYQYFALSDEYENCFLYDRTVYCIDSSSSDSEDDSTSSDDKNKEKQPHTQKMKKAWRRNRTTIYNPKRLINSSRMPVSTIGNKDTEKAELFRIKEVVDESIEKLRLHTSKLKWISVGQSESIDMKLKMSYISENKQMKKTATQPGLPNFSTTGVSLRFLNIKNALQKFMARNEYHDHRILALKVNLYDNLREKSFSQPSGVDYAWAAQKPPVRDIISLNSFSEWHYDAVFVTTSVIDTAIANRWKLKVGEAADGVVWSLEDPDVRIIPLFNTREITHFCLYVWILSHLDYPLAWVIDQFEMVRVGNEDQRTEEAFIHTAGLIDINQTINKLIFVCCAVNIANTKYQANKEGEKIVIHNFVKPIEKILDHCLRSTESLRTAFSYYTQDYFPSGINWLEINSLTTTLIVRWHQRIECYKKNKEAPTLAVGAPPSVLTTMGLTPDPKITEDPAYGGMAAVNSLDQRFIERELARQNPAVKLGSWGNMASLAVSLNYAVYNTQNVTEPQQTLARCPANVHDCLSRARFLRKGFEQWKRTAGQDDRIAFPHAGNEAKLNWMKLTAHSIQNSKKRTTGSFAEYFVAKHVEWSWDMNQSESSSQKTLTGIRTISSWWRGQKNTQWFSPDQKHGQQKSDMYIYSTSDWSRGSYAQIGLGVDNPEIERTLMRIDLNTDKHDWGLTYKSHLSTQKEVPGTCWIVDSSYGGRLAASLGWLKDGIAMPVKDLWGWGIALRLKNDCEQVMKTLVIPYKTAGIATGNYFSDGTILFTDQPVNPIFEIDKPNLNENTECDLTIKKSVHSFVENSTDAE